MSLPGVGECTTKAEFLNKKSMPFRSWVQLLLLNFDCSPFARVTLLTLWQTLLGQLDVADFTQTRAVLGGVIFVVFSFMVLFFLVSFLVTISGDAFQDIKRSKAVDKVEVWLMSAAKPSVFSAAAPLKFTSLSSNRRRTRQRSEMSIGGSSKLRPGATTSFKVSFFTWLAHALLQAGIFLFLHPSVPHPRCTVGWLLWILDAVGDLTEQHKLTQMKADKLDKPVNNE